VVSCSSVRCASSSNLLGHLLPLHKIGTPILAAAVFALAIGNERRGNCADVGSVPNIVFILADDLGWRDLSCTGSTFYRTPAIDRLATQGMRFTQAYAACNVCSPTRASITTGKYPARLHTTNFFGGNRRGKLLPPNYRQYLPSEEITIARPCASRATARRLPASGTWAAKARCRKTTAST